MICQKVKMVRNKHNTPVAIKYPFWKMTAANPKAVYACINYGEAVCPQNIEKQSICLNENAVDPATVARTGYAGILKGRLNNSFLRAFTAWTGTSIGGYKNKHRNKKDKYFLWRKSNDL